LVRQHPDLEGVMAFSKMVTCCNQFKFTKQEELLSQYLYSICEESEDNGMGKTIALHFCFSAVTFTPMTKMEWGRVLQEDHLDDLVQHERVHLLV